MQIKYAGLLILLIIMSGCTGLAPIPQDKKSFIGVWVSPNGFQLQILPEGVAHVYQPLDSMDPEYARLGIVRGNSVYNFGFEVEFIGDSILHIVKPYNFGKEYHLDKKPFVEGDSTKMIVNGVVLVKQDELAVMEEM